MLLEYQHRASHAAEFVVMVLPIDFGCFLLHDPGAKSLTVAALGGKGSSYAERLSLLPKSFVPIDPNGLSRCVAGAARLKGIAVETVVLPAVDPFVAPILYAIPVQMLAYQVAVLKGTDVDQPRNLAKSVTVE